MVLNYEIRYKVKHLWACGVQLQNNVRSYAHVVFGANYEIGYEFMHVWVLVYNFKIWNELITCGLRVHNYDTRCGVTHMRTYGA